MEEKYFCLQLEKIEEILNEDEEISLLLKEERREEKKKEKQNNEEKIGKNGCLLGYKL